MSTADTYHDDLIAKREKWAKIWFKKFAAFHGQPNERMWSFDATQVIAFLREHLRRQAPAWKRLKIVESLMYYRRFVQGRPLDDLLPIRSKLIELSEREKRSDSLDRSGEHSGLNSFNDMTDVTGVIDPAEPDVIQNLRREVRGKQRALETERAYVSKVKAFMRDRGLQCQSDFDSITPSDVEAHLTDLAVDGNVAVSTQDQAFYALLFLFTHVLKRDIGKIESIRSKRGKQIPTVMSTDEVAEVLSYLGGVYLLIAQLLYGCGMRISEVLRLRMKDFDFDRMLIEVHASKGGKSRLVPLPQCAVNSIQHWMESRRILHEHDLENGTASVWLPKALTRKYPNAHRELKWQFLFASHRLSRDPRTGVLRRHHLHKDTFPARLRRAVKEAGIDKHISSHTFRHSFATHSLRAGLDICTIQELLGHSDIKTTRIYLHALNRDNTEVISPLDRLQPNADQVGSSIMMVQRTRLQNPSNQQPTNLGKPDVSVMNRLRTDTVDPEGTTAEGMDTVVSRRDRDVQDWGDNKPDQLTIHRPVAMQINQTNPASLPSMRWWNRVARIFRSILAARIRFRDVRSTLPSTSQAQAG